MSIPIRKTHPITSYMNNMLIDLPSPSNISYMWNFGSLLGICLFFQIFTGLLLSMHYCPDISFAFSSMSHITRDVNNGWLMRILHMNGASLFFIFIYLHIGRGIYYSSFSLHMTWNIGVMIFFMSMATAFLGYVLPWGQMSFWGATVITNLLSAIPLLGTEIVNWVWGGFSVNNATLNRFFSLHFILPFVILMFMIFHLTFLHETGSNNPMGTPSNTDKIPFHPFYTLKDMLGLFMMMTLFLFYIMLFPQLLNDPENFIPANPLVTPIHIQPEWYFLFAYAILRSIPNKLGGVLALLLSILILFIFPLTINPKLNNFNPINKFLFWMFVSFFTLLTWLGSKPVEPPFIHLSQIFTVLYFLHIPSMYYSSKLWVNNF